MKALAWVACTLFAIGSSVALSAPLRIASYNVKYLSACINYARTKAIEETLEALNADIVALQEVRDRKALERYFPSDAWNIIIDDQSTDDQNLAFVVKRHVNYRLASGEKHDAQQEDFLFPKSKNFPDNRDVLRLFISVPELSSEMEVLNHHAKSRYNGRVYSEAMRLEAAAEIANYITGLSEARYTILLGDFNDTPDDASLNTLEAGYLAERAIENTPGNALENLAESLLLEDFVTYGLNTRSADGDMIDHKVEGSRLDNFDHHSDEYEVRKALYDQILVTPDLRQASHLVKMHLFVPSVAVVGNSDTRASDHIPIYVDLFDASSIEAAITIERLLVDPIGTDYNNEKIEIKSNLNYRFNDTLDLRDAAGNKYSELVTIEPMGTIVISPASTRFSLNNDGDSVQMAVSGKVLDKIEYQTSSEGEWIAL